MNSIDLSFTHDEATVSITIESETHPVETLLNAIALSASTAMRTTSTEAEPMTLVITDGDFDIRDLRDSL
jgi:hypothetical protein